MPRGKSLDPHALAGERLHGALFVAMPESSYEWETLEELKKAGASSMLVLPVEKMLS